MVDESEERKRWVGRTLKLVEKLQPVAGCVDRAEPHLVLITSTEAAALIVALATTYVVAEGDAIMTGKGGALLDATLQQWAKPPESVS